MTTATPHCPDHRSLPREKRTPRSRDLAILVAYRTRGCTQAELAKEYDLSQRRISTILRRVEHWIASGGAPGVSEGYPSGSGATAGLPSGALDRHAQLRLDRWLERERNQSIFDRAIRAHDHAPRELTTTTVHSKSPSSPPLQVSPSPTPPS